MQAWKYVVEFYTWYYLWSFKLRQNKRADKFGKSTHTFRERVFVATAKISIEFISSD